MYFASSKILEISDLSQFDAGVFGTTGAVRFVDDGTGAARYTGALLLDGTAGVGNDNPVFKRLGRSGATAHVSLDTGLVIVGEACGCEGV